MKCINFFCVALNKLIQKIDKRHFASARQQHSGFKSKDRTPGSPSSLLPPDGCPKWVLIKPGTERNQERNETITIINY